MDLWMSLTESHLTQSKLFFIIYYFFHFLVEHPSRAPPQKTGKPVPFLACLFDILSNIKDVPWLPFSVNYIFFMWPPCVINIKVNWLLHLYSSYMGSVFVWLCNCMYQKIQMFCINHLLSVLFTNFKCYIIDSENKEYINKLFFF